MALTVPSTSNARHVACACLHSYSCRSGQLLSTQMDQGLFLHPTTKQWQFIAVRNWRSASTSDGRRASAWGKQITKQFNRLSMSELFAAFTLFLPTCAPAPGPFIFVLWNYSVLNLRFWNGSFCENLDPNESLFKGKLWQLGSASLRLLPRKKHVWRQTHAVHGGGLPWWKHRVGTPPLSHATRVISSASGVGLFSFLSLYAHHQQPEQSNCLAEGQT